MFTILLVLTVLALTVTVVGYIMNDAAAAHGGILSLIFTIAVGWGGVAMFATASSSKTDVSALVFAEDSAVHFSVDGKIVLTSTDFKTCKYYQTEKVATLVIEKFYNMYGIETCEKITAPDPYIKVNITH